MDSFDKVNYGANSSKFSITSTTTDNLSNNLMEQRRKTIDQWILKRKEAWKFHEELLRSLTNQPTNDGRVFDAKKTERVKEMKAVHEELLRMVETKERREEESGMFVPRRVFLFNVDTFKHSQQVEGFETPNIAAPVPGNGVSTPEINGSQQSHVKSTDAKSSSAVQPSIGQGVFSRLKKYFGF